MGALEITRALRGRWHGKYGLAFCPAHPNHHTPALSISDGREGRILVTCHAGCDRRLILQALREQNLLEPGHPGVRIDPAAEARRRADELSDLERRSVPARRLWNETLPITGTVAERYLRGRGITCPMATALRFAPSLRHESRQSFPAMVAFVEGTNGFGVHRTWMRSDGSGKADVTPNKAMLGPVKGGAVRLIDTGGPLVVAEGIETAMSLASGILKAPATIWAALSATGMRGLRLPPRPGRLTIATDGDLAGRTNGRELARRAYREGWEVYLLDAPDGQDWNDVLNAQVAA